MIAMAVKASHLFGVGLIAGGVYYLTIRQPSPPPPPPPPPSPEPPEPPTGYTVEEVEEWVYEQFPNARRLSPEEAGILEIDAGWVQLTYAGGKPKHAAVAFLKQGELAYHILVIEPNVNDLGRDIASLVGFGIVGLPEGEIYYEPAITPPKMWYRWIAEDKLAFIAFVEAIVQITPPTPGPLEAEIRRAEYYNLVENTKAPVILFEHADFKGVWMPVWGDLPELPDELDRQVSAIMLVRHCFLEIFDEKHYEGESVFVIWDYSNLNTLYFNNKARSVKFPW